MPGKMGADSDGISIKGISQGLLLVLGDGEWPERLDALTTRLNDNPHFFTGGQLALDVGARALSIAQVETIRDRNTGDASVSCPAYAGGIHRGSCQ